jgi:hypothetical protein
MIAHSIQPLRIHMTNSMSTSLCRSRVYELLVDNATEPDSEKIVNSDENAVSVESVQFGPFCHGGVGEEEPIFPWSHKFQTAGYR